MLIERTDPFATAKPDARLIKLLIRAHRFNTALVSSDVPFTTLAKREGVSASYFTRLIRLSYLAPDITQAIHDGRQPPGLTADKLLAHSRLPLTWHDQRTVLGSLDRHQLPPARAGDPLGPHHGHCGTEIVPAETLSPIGGMSQAYPCLCRPRHFPWPAHPREKPWFSTAARCFP